MNIDIKNIAVRYGNKNIIDGFSFLFEKNHIYAILGPNGCGKTTLMNKIVDEYSKTIDISYVAQNTFGELELNAYDVVALGRFKAKDFYHTLNDEDRMKIDEAIASMDVKEVIDRNFDLLSGGEKQRIQIARALAKDSKWLLCDEPTSSLDVKHQVLFAKKIKSLKEENKSIILVLHDINLAMSIADRIILMKEGKIYKAGTPEEIMTEENLKACFETDFVKVQNPDSNMTNFIYNI